jgi:thymidylate synthase
MISDDFQIGPNGAYEHVGNKLDKQYQTLLQTILDFGVEKKDRTGTGTKSIFGYTIRHNMKDGFPLLTTKKMAWKTMVTELIWFLRGDTNIKYLVDNNCHIWDGDAYQAYKRGFKEKHYLKPTSTKEEFINKIKTDDEFAKKWGSLGKIYGYQWRSWEGKGDYRLPENISDWVYTESGLPVTEYQPKHIDQIANLISELKTNPDSRRLLVSAWNVSDVESGSMVLPPCHYGFQVYTRELSEKERLDLYFKLNPEFRLVHEDMNEQMNKHNIPTRAISLMYNCRSQDVPLGTPFNISSYALLLEIIAKQVNMVSDQLIGNLGDCHIYLNQIDGVKEQLTREPYPLPTVKISDRVVNDISEYTLDDIILENYQSHPTIKMPLSN